MFESFRRRFALCLVPVPVLLFFGAGCAPEQSVNAGDAEHGHEHAEPEPVAITVFTETAELFMEYPRLVKGSEARFLAHVTVLLDGAPVRSGKLRIEVEQPGGTKVLEALQPTRDGLFIPVGSFDTPGEFAAKLILSSDQTQETIELPPFVVHANLHDAIDAGEAAEVEEPADVMPFLLEQQWKIGMVMRQVQRRSLTKRLQVPGEVEAPQDAMAAVGAPLAGRLMPLTGGRLPQVGDQVEAGQVLGMLVPPTSIADAAALEANQASRHAIETELQLRQFEVGARALEIREAVHHSELELAFAQRTLARVESLRAKDLGTQKELENAQLAVELALHDGEGARGLEEAFESMRQQLEQLKADNLERGKSTALNPQLLIAPITGEIVEASHVAGEHVQSDDSVYRIMNLERVWIATHISEFDFAEVSASSGALLEFAAYPERRFDVLGEMNGRVVNVGRVVNPETRTIELRYEADNPDGLLRAGMFVDAYLETKHARNAIAIPESAIVMDNGQPVAFVLWHGEAFRKVVLTLGIRDGGFVEILEGIEEGDRVVTKQAYLVKLASASPAAFGEGHAH